MSTNNSFNKLLIFLYGLFITSTCMIIWIIYKDINHSWTFPFIISYISFLMVFFCYLLLASLLKIRKLTSTDIKKRILRFVFYFCLLSVVSLMLSLFGITELNLVSSILLAFGMAFGIAFLDLAFIKQAP